MGEGRFFRVFKLMPKRIVKRLTRRRAKPVTDQQRRLIERLRMQVSGLGDLNGASLESEAERAWSANRMRLRELIMQDDPRRFTEWEVVRKTMFVGNAGYIRDERAALQRSAAWPRWARAIREDPMGLPERCKFDLRSSGNLIHHAYSLMQFEETAGRQIADVRSIVEFGGGYGSFCRLVHRLGFSGRYIIFDLPEFCALQVYYLNAIGVPAACGRSEGRGNHRVVCLSDLSELAEEIGQAPVDLFVALWSLSETSEAFRRAVLTPVSKARAYLIAFQHRFGEVDNLRFFERWVARRDDMRWRQWEIGHLPGNNYLVGTSVH